MSLANRSIASDNATGPTAVLLGNILPTVIGTVFVAAKLYSKGFLVRSWGHDDTSLLLAFIMGLVEFAITCWSTTLGVGKHWSTLNSSQKSLIFESNYLIAIFYMVSVILTKLSSCFFYKRIFSDKVSCWIANITGAFILAFGVPMTLIQIFQCKPLSEYWSLSPTPGACLALDTLKILNILFPVFNMTFDFWLIVITVPKIVPLRLARKQKIILLIIVSSGWICLVASAIRLSKLLNHGTGKLDPSYGLIPLSIWTSVEINVGFFCNSAPALRPILDRFFPRFVYLLSSRSPNYGSRSQGVSGARKQTRTYGPGSRLGSQYHPSIPGAFELNDTYIRAGSAGTGMNAFDHKSKAHDFDDDLESPPMPTGVPVSQSPGEVRVGGKGLSGGIMTSTSVMVVSERAVSSSASDEETEHVMQNTQRPPRSQSRRTVSRTDSFDDQFETIDQGRGRVRGISREKPREF